MFPVQQRSHDHHGIPLSDRCSLVYIFHCTYDAVQMSLWSSYDTCHFLSPRRIIMFVFSIIMFVSPPLPLGFLKILHLLLTSLVILRYSESLYVCKLVYISHHTSKSRYVYFLYIFTTRHLCLLFTHSISFIVHLIIMFASISF